VNKLSQLSVFAGMLLATCGPTMEFGDGSWSEPKVTETPKRRRVWLPVVHPDARPLRDRKRLLASKAK
jgi:hypothetical protein